MLLLSVVRIDPQHIRIGAHRLPGNLYSLLHDTMRKEVLEKALRASLGVIFVVRSPHDYSADLRPLIQGVLSRSPASLWAIFWNGRCVYRPFPRFTLRRTPFFWAALTMGVGLLFWMGVMTSHHHSLRDQASQIHHRQQSISVSLQEVMRRNEVTYQAQQRAHWDLFLAIHDLPIEIQTLRWEDQKLWIDAEIAVVMKSAFVPALSQLSQRYDWRGESRYRYVTDDRIGWTFEGQFRWPEPSL